MIFNHWGYAQWPTFAACSSAGKSAKINAAANRDEKNGGKKKPKIENPAAAAKKKCSDIRSADNIFAGCGEDFDRIATHAEPPSLSYLVCNRL